MNATGHLVPEQEAGFLTLERLRLTWPARPPRRRRQALVLLARELHRLWKEGYILSRLRLEDLRLDLDAEPCRVRVVTTDLPRDRRPLPVNLLESALVAWHQQMSPVLSAREGLAFLHEMLQQEGLHGRALQHVRREIQTRSLEQNRVKARRLQESILHEPVPWWSHAEGRVRGHWQLDPRLPADQWWDALCRARQDPSTVVIKSGPGGGVFRARMFERDVLIKQYRHKNVFKKLKYLFRPSRGRRAFAAARTLSLLGMATPDPLGYAEQRVGHWPGDSYLVTEFLPVAVPARTWMERAYPGRPDDVRSDFRRQLLEALLSLYRCGVYHADTKTSNLLLVSPEDPARRRLLWIDLECLEFGREIGRRKIFRNLVQLNGSLGPSVSRSDRLDFLRAMARSHPWVASPGLQRRIALKTWWRLKKEALGWAGQ